jgi:putative sterol carrier protein
MAKFVSPAEIFAAMPGGFISERAAGLTAVIQFDLTGEGGGQWHATIAEQQLQVAQGTAALPTMTLTMAAGDYVAMTNGDLSPMTAFMQGKIKVAGDMQLALKMQNLFARPG